MKVLFTGGHLTPALALIDYLQLHNPEIEIVFVGREFSRAKLQVAHERSEVSARNIAFYPIHSGKLSFSNPIQFLIQSIRILTAVIQSLRILLKLKPQVCVSFGSYLAVPVSAAAWILRIPIITHEQTKTAGFANRIIGKLATKIALAYPESQQYFPKRKSKVLGNLVREKVLSTSAPKPEWIPKSFGQPMLYITGGSQGSEIINSTVAQVLKPLLKDWFVIHQCGNPSGQRNYAAELRGAAEHVPIRLQQKYIVREWISDTELAWIYSHANGAISRAGANSVEELALRQIPSIFIPLPFSLNDEQLHNAQALSDCNQALLLLQKDLSPERLIITLSELTQHEKKIHRNLSSYQSKSTTALPAMTAMLSALR